MPVITSHFLVLKQDKICQQIKAAYLKMFIHLFKEKFSVEPDTVLNLIQYLTTN